MIGTLTGIVDEILDNRIILSVGGIGYVVYLPYRTLQNCRRSDTIKLYIETYVNRENVPQLYGFSNTEEQNCLRMLIKVSGVNYKTALAILDKLTTDEIFSAILNEDKARLKVAGVGDRIASRILTELTPAVQKLELSSSIESNVGYTDNEAVAALLSLGYDKTHILQALQKIGNTSSLSETVRSALRELSK